MAASRMLHMSFCCAVESVPMGQFAMSPVHVPPPLLLVLLLLPLLPPLLLLVVPLVPLVPPLLLVLESLLEQAWTASAARMRTDERTKR